jgi:antitoxin (DNA-binding transcriptional repressor) of toxin-antitoxin stability system
VRADDPEQMAAEVREVPLRQLNRRTSDVVSGLGDGERLVVTRYGIPVAVMLSIADAFELVRGATGCSELERQAWRRELGRYLHGRWRSR